MMHRCFSIRFATFMVGAAVSAALPVSAQEPIQKALLGFTGPFSPPPLTEILGRPTHQSITLNLRSDTDGEAYVEVGRTPGHYEKTTSPVPFTALQPVEITLDALTADTRHRKRRAMLLARQASLAELGFAYMKQYGGGKAGRLGFQSASASAPPAASSMVVPAPWGTET